MLKIRTFLQTVDVIIGKWKSDVNSGPIRTPIRSWLYQQFVKIL